MKKFTIEVNEEQLRLIATSMDSISRLQSGDLRQLNYVLVSELLDKKIDRFTLDDKLDELKSVYFPELSPTSHYGVNGEEKERNKLYDMYRSIYHFLSILNKQDNVYSSKGLNYTGNSLKISEVE